jgi:hypothetical protein
MRLEQAPAPREWQVPYHQFYNCRHRSVHMLTAIN